MRLDIRYVSRFDYDGEVVQSHNLLRARPADNERQRLHDYRVEVDPPASVRSYVDYWGTWVDVFAVVEPHTRLTVAAAASAETSPGGSPQGGAPWPKGVDHYEFLAPSPHVQWDDEVADFGRDAVAGHGGVVDAACRVQAAVGSHLTYRPGATEVGTPVEDVFRDRVGVCQDFSHFALAVLRSLGVPSRYVSGYLYALDSSSGDAPPDAEIEVSTHAWIEVWIPGFGWWGLDPTNQLEVGERHVKIGHGRDYEDVTPFRGVFHGSSSNSGLEASVSMSRDPLGRYRFEPRPPDPAVAEIQQQQ